MEWLTRVLVLLSIPLLLGANDPVGSASEAAKRQLLGKWIVRSVQRDGEPNKAQAGREVGDVIEIKEGVGGIGFG